MGATERVGPSSTVGDVVDRLSPVLLDLLAAPNGTAHAARRVTILAPGDDSTMVSPGDIVLLVGDRPGSPTADDAVARATVAGASAVIVKVRPGETADAELLATRHGIAVIGAPGNADWGQVFALLRTALSGTGTSEAPDGGPADLFSLANAIAVATGGATTIEDLQLRVVAYSNLDQPIDDVRRDSILGRSVPTYVMQRGDMVEMYRRLWADTDIVRLPAEDGGRVRPRLGAVVRAGDEAVGTIWVIEGDRPFDDHAETVLAESTRRAAVLLLRHQEAGDAERRHRAERARVALDAGDPLPIDLTDDEHVRVVAFGQRPGVATGDAASLAMRRRRLVDLVAMQLELVDVRSVAVDVGDAVLALIPESTSAGAGKRRDTVSAIVQRASHAMKSPVLAGIGGAGGTPAAIATARWEAEQALAVIAEGEPSARAVEVVGVDDVRNAVVMRRVRHLVGSDVRCHTPHLDLLRHHDALHHTDHVATLGAWFDAFGDVASAARILDVHPNTLRYRLKRIVDVLGVDLSDPVTRFTIELQWRTR